MTKRVCLLLTLVMLLGLGACGRKPAESAQTTAAPEEAAAGLANPWREITEAEAEELCPKSFTVPDGAENVSWSAMDSAADASGVPGALVQLAFDWNGNRFTAREQVTGEEETDSSGMYYAWTAQGEEPLANWADGTITAQRYRFIGENEYADLCTWYDGEAGVSYSLGVTAADLDGFDLLAVVEMLCP